VIAQVAANIGGVARMTEWVRKSAENEKAFWINIYPKLLPLQVAGDRDNPLTMINRMERVIVQKPEPPDDRVLPAPIHDEASKSTTSPRHWAA
jgi:hypothetical protein